MRSAKTVLGIIRDRGRRGLPLERVYRLLYNRDLYLLAYGKIARNHGALTPGATPETADGMTLAKIDAIIEALRFERHRWTPVRRTYIEKKHSTKKKRPLGIPSWSDKLLQEVLRLILDAYYEPQFSDHSHGFRHGRGCHTALQEVYHGWVGTAWFIELDVAQFFDRLSHEVLISILAEKIHDDRFLRLIGALLKAGYLEQWRFNATLSGVPQGGIVSPVLANAYLDRLDQWIDTTLLPAYTRGYRRRPNSEYERLMHRAKYLHRTGRRQQARPIRQQAQRLPSVDPNDPDYRRLHYLRYADDVLLGFNGPRAEAEAIKHQIDAFLREQLHLELSEPKTLLTHARTDAARFLGYEITVLAKDEARDQHGRRSLNGQIGLRVPAEVIRTKCRPYVRRGKPTAWAEHLHDDPFSILVQFQQTFRGVANYYRMAYNLHRLDWLRYTMERSLVRTLGKKLRLSNPQVYRRFGAMLQTPDGPRKGLQVRVERKGRRPLIAEWGGISLRWRIDAVLDDRPPHAWNARTEVLERLLADTCELCGSHEGVQVHHVRHLKDLQRHRGRPVPAWVQKMAARHRKTLVACHNCHVAIHAGRPAGVRVAA
jgi:group II intron reverse transcriptase/maturase